jgi:hypothetical protein
MTKGDVTLQKIAGPYVYGVVVTAEDQKETFGVIDYYLEDGWVIVRAEREEDDGG